MYTNSWDEKVQQIKISEAKSTGNEQWTSVNVPLTYETFQKRTNANVSKTLATWPIM